MHISRTRRIALYLPALLAGGAERVMLNLARGFSERGLCVDLVLAKAEGAYLSQVPSAVRVVDLNASRVLWSLPALVRYLRRERPDAMLSTLDHANVIALWARKLARTPTRMVVRVPNTTSIASTRAQSLRGRMMPFFMRYFYAWADKIVVVSRGAAEDLAKFTRFPPKKVQIIYNPVMISELRARAEESTDDAWLTQDESPVILGVGRLTQQKDFQTLIQAFALVRQQLPAHLMILGEGEERSSIEKLIRRLNLTQVVKLVGFVENPYKYMKRASVFVLSSRWEGLPNSLLEALAVGVPVVSTDCPSGPREILEDGKWGKLVPVGNPQALAEAILDTLRNPPPFDPAVRAADFSIERVVEAYLDALGIQHKSMQN